MAKIGQKALSEHLKRMAQEVHEVLPDGTQVSREERLAELIWKQALGYEETLRDEYGNLKKTVHKPVAWAQQYLYERVDGKAPIAQTENISGIRAADRVRSLAVDRMNKLASVASGPPVASPKRKAKGPANDDGRIA